MAVQACWLATVTLLFCVHRVDGAAVNKYLSPREEFEPLSIDEAIARAAAKGTSGRSTSDSSKGPGMRTEGMDMVLTEKQYRRLHTGVRGRDEGHTVATPWTDGIIPYTIVESDFDAEQLQRIDRAMRNWEAVTCVQFRPMESSDENYVNISSMAGCWAILGMLGGAQRMSLQASGCFWKGTIEHEFGHALGLIHEHQRPTRDPYIKVDYYAIKSSNVKDLKKYADGSDDKMGLEYDYTSVMHYGKTAFGNMGRQTIYTVDPKMSDVIGMILRPSFIDAKLINLMYQCKDRCPRERQRKCEGECFLTKDCTCFCPDDIVQENCIDQDPDCAEKVLKGKCRTESGHMHDKCRKSCGVCTTDSSLPHLRCVNGAEMCETWKKSGQCEKNPGYMLKTCAKACGQCQEHVDYEKEARCVDKANNCTEFAANGECDKNPRFGIKQCRKTCKFCIENMHDPKPVGGCRDVDSVCSYYADSGYCVLYYTWMAINCPKACDQCDFILPEGCTDDNKDCSSWAFRGECDNNPGFMHKSCKLSCNKCQGITVPTTCMDFNLDCQKWSEEGQCEKNKEWMARYCKKSCRYCGSGSEATTRRTTRASTDCRDSDDQCPGWAARGECTKNPAWMPKNCPKSCGICSGVGPVTTAKPDECADLDARCPKWQAQRKCQDDAEWMARNCNKSCGYCDGDGYTPGPCVDQNEFCAEWAIHGECAKNPETLNILCPVSCRLCTPTLTTPKPNSYCQDKDEGCPNWRGLCRSQAHLAKLCPYSCKMCSGQSSICMDIGDYCEDWAKNGDCQRNPTFMRTMCRKSCRYC